LGELFVSELLLPFGFDLAHDFADRCSCGASSAREVDPLRALIGLVVLAGEVSELLQLPD
jgi:hypothetical protein